jgi:hypothetical protein
VDRSERLQHPHNFRQFEHSQDPQKGQLHSHGLQEAVHHQERIQYIHFPGFVAKEVVSVNKQFEDEFSSEKDIERNRNHLCAPR